MSDERKRGRPLGKKDGPRRPNAPPRGRPSKKPAKKAAPTSPRANTPSAVGVEADDEYEFDEEITEEDWRIADEIAGSMLQHPIPPFSTTANMTTPLPPTNSGATAPIPVTACASGDDQPEPPHSTLPPLSLAPTMQTSCGTDDNDANKPPQPLRSDPEPSGAVPSVRASVAAALSPSVRQQPMTGKLAPGTSPNPSGTSASTAPGIRSAVDDDSRHDESAETTQLRDIAKQSEKVPFFTHHPCFDVDSESDESLDSQDEDDQLLNANSVSAGIPAMQAWFKKPKYMSDWLYEYFRDTVSPMIHSKTGRTLDMPLSFTESQLHSPASFWIHQPEPAIGLSKHQFYPPSLYRPRIFLWLPHFYVKSMCCPSCGKVLEKNGALRPRRIVDMEDVFYIV